MENKVQNIEKMEKKDGVISTDSSDNDKRYIKIEDILKRESQDTGEEANRYDFLTPKYLFRFPFMITSIKWGLGLGAVFGLHSYVRSKSIMNASYWFLTGTFMTGIPIFGFFMFKHTFYQIAIKKFEHEQNSLIEESTFKKEYVRKKLNVKNELITDDDLMTALGEKQKSLYARNSFLDELSAIEQIDFDKIQDK